MLFYAIEIIFRLILFAGGSIINSSNSFLLVPSACLSYSIHCTCLIPTRAAVRMAKRPVVVYYYRTVSCNCRFRPVQFTVFSLSALYGHCLLFATIRLPYLRRKDFKFFLSLFKLFKREQPSIASLSNSITSQLKTFSFIETKM